MLRLAQQVQSLDDDGDDATADGDAEEGRQTRVRFSEILRVAEDQASTLVDNASTSAQRLLDDANAERDRIRRDTLRRFALEPDIPGFDRIVAGLARTGGGRC